jgi:hypothetical protein
MREQVKSDAKEDTNGRRGNEPDEDKVERHAHRKRHLGYTAGHWPFVSGIRERARPLGESIGESRSIWDTTGNPWNEPGRRAGLSKFSDQLVERRGSKDIAGHFLTHSLGVRQVSFAITTCSILSYFISSRALCFNYSSSHTPIYSAISG